MKRIFFLMASVLCSASAAFAQDEAFGWMCREQDPMYSALSGATTASSSGIAFSAFRNPAASVFSSEKFAAGVSYSFTGNLKTGSSISAGAGMHFGKRIALAVAGNYNPGSEYSVIDDFGNVAGTYKTSSMYFSAGVGVKIIDMLSVGVNLKYVGEKLAPQSFPGAFASDIYAMFKWKGLGVSAGVANLGTKVKDSAGSAFSLPSSARVGVNYSESFASKHSVEAGLEADAFFSGRFSAAAGVQYGFNDMVFVRGGYRYGGNSVLPSSASFGMGCKFVGIRIDLAYVLASSSYKSDMLAISLGYSF